MRACSWAVRGAHDGSRGVATHLQHGPRSGTPLTRGTACTRVVRVSTPVRARGRSERGRGTANGSSRCLSTPLGDAVGVRAWCGCGWGDERAGRQCMPRFAVKLASFTKGAESSEHKHSSERKLR